MAIATLILTSAIVVFLGYLLLSIFIVRTPKREYYFRHDFDTKHGIRIRLSGSLLDLKHEVIEDWTEDIIDFWIKKKRWRRKHILKALSKVSIIMYDKQYLDRADIKVSGITWPEQMLIELAVISKDNIVSLKRVHSLFKHEVSHIIVGIVGHVDWTNKLHHKIFEDVNLN